MTQSALLTKSRIFCMKVEIYEVWTTLRELRRFLSQRVNLQLKITSRSILFWYNYCDAQLLAWRELWKGWIKREMSEKNQRAATRLSCHLNIQVNVTIFKLLLLGPLKSVLLVRRAVTLHLVADSYLVRSAAWRQLRCSERESARRERKIGECVRCRDLNDHRALNELKLSDCCFNIGILERENTLIKQKYLHFL